MRVWLLKIKRQALNNSFLSLVCRYHNVNISVAVQTEHGLMVPVVKVLSRSLNQYEESSMECLCHNVLLIQSCQMMTNLFFGWSLQDADKKGLATITDDVKVLAGKARSNTLKPNDYEVCHIEPTCRLICVWSFEVFEIHNECTSICNLFWYKPWCLRLFLGAFKTTWVLKEGPGLWAQTLVVKLTLVWNDEGWIRKLEVLFGPKHMSKF